MSLAEELVAWANARSDWQKAALGRFCRNTEYSAEDIFSLADQLMDETTLPAPDISIDDVPGASSSGDRVVLNSLHGLSGVNALLPDQALTFAKVGITVIYGNNGSGKSGYARVLREAVTARVKGELLGDVFAEETALKAATVDFTVGDAQQRWELGQQQVRALTSVRFFDLDCGEDYISKAAEITYRPYALTLLDRLQTLCRALQEEFDRRLAANRLTHPELPELDEGTEAADFVRRLSKDTHAEEIIAATTLTEDHAEVLAARLREIARLRASNPNAERDRLAAVAKNWRVIEVHVDALNRRISQQGLADAAAIKDRARDLRVAAQIASTEQFPSEPLKGIGSDTWRALWNAAREFSMSDGYHDHDFPVVEEGAVCVLCQQPFSESGADRMARFQSFVMDSASREASQAEATLAETRAEYAVLQGMPSSVSTAISELRASGQEVDAVVDWIAVATEAAVDVVAWIDGRLEELPTGIPEGPAAVIGALHGTASAAAGAIDASTFNATFAMLESQVNELQARERLASLAQSVVRAVDSLKERHRIDTAKRETSTTGITQKATELTTKYVTALARDQFTREADRLELKRITLNPVRGRHNSTLEHQPALLGATVRADVTDVFSEGEKTALGLAGFLTEVHLDSSGSAVVFDDPVSSMDAGRRSRVARRIMELASERQVVVFTHEITFVNELLRQAEELSQDVAPRSIQRSGGKPGKVSAMFPWAAKDIPQRLDALRSDLARIRREQATLDDEEYTKRVRAWSGDLSETWERALNLEIVNQVVDRGTNEVKPLKLKILPKFDQADHDEFQNGYRRVSSWAARHDNAPEENFQPPLPDELEDELRRLVTWHSRVKAYKN